MSDFDDRSSSYDKEKAKRWGMAAKGEPEAIVVIAEELNSKLKASNYELTRYDEEWFEIYPPNSDNEWVKGTPDYCIDFSKEENHLFAYIEIKIKAVEFRKTFSGGTTRDGSSISKYGCSSYYLDIEPVYRNMNDFCDKIGLDKSKFVIVFISESYDCIRYITLKEVVDMTSSGWNGAPLCIYGEGYGATCYLIPKDATHKISKLSNDFLHREYLDAKKI